MERCDARKALNMGGGSREVRGVAKVRAAVENFRTIRFCATIAPVTRACSNFDSMNRGILNHRFKKFDLRDFFSAPSLIYDTAGTGGYMNGL